MPCERIKGLVAPWLRKLQRLPTAHGNQKTLRALNWASDTFPTPSRLSPKRTLCPNRRPGALWAPGWPSSPSPQGTARGSRTPRGLPDCPIRRGLFYEFLAFTCWEKRPVLEPDRPGLESALVSVYSLVSSHLAFLSFHLPRSKWESGPPCRGPGSPEAEKQLLFWPFQGPFLFLWVMSSGSAVGCLVR